MEDFGKESVEVCSQVSSLLLIFTVHELLDLSAKTIKRATRLPRSHQICNDHSESSSLLHGSFKAKTTHERLEGTLYFYSLLIDKGHELFPLPLSISLFFGEFTLDLSLLGKVAPEASLDLLGTDVLLEAVCLGLHRSLAHLDVMSFTSFD